MSTADCNMELVLAEPRPANWEVAELNRRAGALVREALANWAASVQRMHWQDMQQTAVRKMIILPHGIYTITYKRRSKNAGKPAGLLEASLQKGRRVNGRNLVRTVHLGSLADYEGAAL